MNNLKLAFRTMKPDDWEIVAEIYKEGIETNNATFEQVVPTWKEWDKEHFKKCRIIALVDNKIAGWAALTPVSERCVYAGVAEVSVYVANNFRGQNIGRKLLNEIIIESEEENLWTLQAGIFPENISSLTIHEKLGFRKVGYREKIGKMNDKWRDVILLERRSRTVGND